MPATTTPTNQAYLLQPREAEPRWTGDSCAYFLATGAETGGAFCLTDEQANRGETVPLHRHEHDVESFYVLEGEITFFVGDRPGVRTARGAFVHVPGGTVHGFRVESETARYLILTTPPRAGGLPPLTAISGAAIEGACAQFGVEFVGPLPDVS